jgi:hypothetical protein
LPGALLFSSGAIEVDAPLDEGHAFEGGAVAACR